MKNTIDVKGYEGLYSVSEDGKVFNRYGKELKPFFTKDKRYYRVKLYKDSVPKTISVHRVVASSFIPNPKNKPEVNHINGNRYDNSVENLEWATRKENHAHAIREGLSDTKSMSEATKKKVQQYDLQGNLVKEWDSMSEASRSVGVWVSNISHCRKGKIKQTGGYIWR